MLTRHDEDSDVLHETIMQIDPEVVAALYQKDAVLMRSIIDRFVGMITTQAWPFEYTDRIGEKCKNLFYAIDDYEIRASLAFCVAEVGTSHNRWYVMRIAGELLADIQDRGCAMSVVEKLRTLSPYALSNLQEYCEVHRCLPIIREVFP